MSEVLAMVSGECTNPADIQRYCDIMGEIDVMLRCHVTIHEMTQKAAERVRNGGKGGIIPKWAKRRAQDSIRIARQAREAARALGYRLP